MISSSNHHAPVPSPLRVVRFELAPRTIIALVVLAAAVWMLVRLAPVLLVLVAALLIVGALNPLVTWLEQRKCRRGFAICLVFGIAIGLTALALSLSVPPLLGQIRTVIEHEPEIREHLAGYLESLPVARGLAQGLRSMDYGDLLKNSQAMLLNLSMRAVEIIAYGLAAVFLALYIMIDRDRLRGAVFSLIPRNHHVRTSRVLLHLETIVGGYIRGQVITCVAIAAFIFAVLLVCRVPNALAFAVFGGAMDLLPYIGAFLTILPAVGAAFVVGPGVALTVFLLLLAYEEFESRVLVPLVYGRALRLPSSVVFFSLLAGGALGGIVGALLALPLASALLMLLEELRVSLPGETEQPEDIVVRRKDEREEREYAQRTEAAPAVEAAAIAVEIARERKDEEKDAAAKLANQAAPTPSAEGYVAKV